ncbi:hypothetical protein [Rhodococcus sp. B10]|uniref:hypothetical protein n=1 Tax=Rhodococcus sp. B10 TaxID=2695876 RepID=UPI001430342B|nr:hypothetical protein [Rhodococcus sp. B10]NIL74410.1 hypothetical protein [Rhodococcus sp. B10]
MRQAVAADLFFDVAVAQTPIIFLPASAELPFDVTVVQQPTGGTYTMAVAAELPLAVDPLTVPVAPAAPSFDFAVAAATSPVVEAAPSLQFDVAVSQYVLANQGIDKSGNQILTTANVWTRLSPWAVRSGYPATGIVDGDGIRIPAGVVASYEYRLAVGSGAGTANSQSMRLVNGSTVVDSVTIANTSTTATRTGTFTGTGEVARLEASVTSTNSGRGTITASTYLVLTVI